jgi:hypothetical protein
MTPDEGVPGEANLFDLVQQRLALYGGWGPSTAQKKLHGSGTWSSDPDNREPGCAEELLVSLGIRFPWE